MTPDQLGTALRDLVDGVEDDALAPAPGELWRDGTRRRVRTRAVTGLAAASVAAMVALLAWPAGEPRASVPAVQVDDRGHVRLTSYPAAIAKPPFVEETDRPGLTAAVVTQLGDARELYAVSPEGTVTSLALPPASPAVTGATVSPDGRYLVRGTVVHDLVEGQMLSSASVRVALDGGRMPTESGAWWSPDSRHAFVDAVNQGVPSSTGIAVTVDGSVTEAPLLTDGGIPVVAGWLDDDTVLALLDTGDGWSLRTWTLGASAWGDTGVVARFGPSEVGMTRAGLSPDGSRLLMWRATEDDAGQLNGTEAMMFDPTTGAQLGMPTSDGRLVADRWSAALGWDAWGCRPAWREGLPVVTDGAVRFSYEGVDQPLVTVSDRFGEGACVSFAGDELRGEPRTDASQVWLERGWSFVLPAALLFTALLGVAWWLRRPSRLGRRTGHLPMLWSFRS